MTIRRLSQYRFICREIEQLGDRLEKLEGQKLHAAVLSSDGPGFALREISIQSETAEVKKLKNILRKRERRLLRERADIEQFIDGVVDSHMRQIIYLRCVEGMSFIRIANKTSSTEGGVKQAFYRFMKSCSDCSEKGC